MDWDDLQAAFPNLRPTHGVPFAGHFFGFGLIFYGMRRDDPYHGSVVRTRYLCLLFVPVLAVDAYRMGWTDRGWLLLGREPVSSTAVLMNIVSLLAMVVGGGALGVHTLVNSEWYTARRQLDRADALVAGGRAGEAVGLFEEVAVGESGYAADAAARLLRLIQEPDAGVTPRDTATAVAASNRVAKVGRWPAGSDGLYAAGMARVNALAGPDPRGASLVLAAVAPLAPKGDAPAALARDLLQRAAAAAPGDADAAAALASLYLSENQAEKAAALLEPLRGQLGGGEGARVLGQIDARAGRVEPGLALLRAYTRPRLVRLRAADMRLRQVVREQQQAVVDRLRRKDDPDFDYGTARRVGPDRQDAMVRRHVESRVSADPKVKLAAARVEDEARVAPAALDLGVLLLQHAQGLADPAARRSELEEAEATFVAVRRIAGDSPEYQAALGQVYYWEGKPREGRAEFDRLLETRRRDPRDLLAVAEMLRELGSVAECRALAEEGYKAATDVDVRRSCATLRGLTESNLDARVDWLTKAAPVGPFDRALLATELASQALARGDEATGQAQLREAIRLYEGLPERSEVLSNLSICVGELAKLTGDNGAEVRSADLAERAATLEPGNSIALLNAASRRLASALRDLAEPRLDPRSLRLPGDVAMFTYLYKDRAGREELARRVAGHPGVARSLALYDRLTLLAPRMVASYESALGVLDFTDDLEGLRKIHRKVMAADLDLSDELAVAREHASGANVEKLRLGLAPRTAPLEAAAEAGRGKPPTPTFALALGSLVTYGVWGQALGAETDGDRLVTLAEEADRAAPSVGTRLVLNLALLARADGRLAKAHPDYARVAGETRRTSLPDDRVVSLLAAGGPLGAAIAADPDVVRVADRVRATVEKTPEDGGPWSWALLRAVHPEAASTMAESYAGRESDRLAREAGERLHPYSAGVTLKAAWARRMAGRDGEADAVLKAFQAEGLPLPLPGLAP